MNDGSRKMIFGPGTRLEVRPGKRGRKTCIFGLLWMILDEIDAFVMPGQIFELLPDLTAQAYS